MAKFKKSNKNNNLTEKHSNTPAQKRQKYANSARIKPPAGNTPSYRKISYIRIKCDVLLTAWPELL